MIKNYRRHLFIRLRIIEKQVARRLATSKLLRNIVGKHLLSFSQGPIQRGLAIGMFCMLLPIPFQMVPAAILCWLALANLPIAILCVWISNPLTYAPLFYACYTVGHYIAYFNQDAATFDKQTFWATTKPLFADFFGMAESGELGTITQNSATILTEIYLITWIGAVVLGIPLAIIAYYFGKPVTKYIHQYHEKRKTKRHAKRQNKN